MNKIILSESLHWVDFVGKIESGFRSVKDLERHPLIGEILNEDFCVLDRGALSRVSCSTTSRSTGMCRVIT